MTQYDFTIPRLHDYNGNLDKAWYVGFNITDPSTQKRKAIQIRLGINAAKSKSERLTLGSSAVGIVKMALSDGWDPFTTRLEDFLEFHKEKAVKKDINRQTFSQAIGFALEKGSWARKTRLGFSSAAGYFKEAAGKLGLCQLPITELKKQHIMQIAAQAKKSKGWSNASYNKYTNYISVILSVLVNWDIIPHNPAHDIKKLPVAETNKYEPYTAAEKKKIYDALHDNHYRFYVLFMVVYHAGVRPKEVLALKIKDIKFDLQEIHILPDLEEENSKTKKIRRIPINPHLLTLLQSLNLEGYPDNYYVFGSPYAKGRGNSGKGVNNPDYFKPSPTRIKRDTITKLWKKLIWEGAGVHKYLYAAKHTGGDDKIMAGVDLDALRDLYGHSSRQMTEKYISRLKEVHKRKIIEKSPDFL